MYVGPAMANTLLETLDVNLSHFFVNIITDFVLPVHGFNLLDTSLRNYHKTKVMR